VIPIHSQTSITEQPKKKKKMPEGSKSDGVITCKAVVCWGPGEALKVEEIQVDPPKSSEVRIKILYSSVCHTDLLLMAGYPSADAFPRAMGHEGVGEVESVGEGVTELKKGDIVIATYVSECKECDNCNFAIRPTNLCCKYPYLMGGVMPDGTSRLSVQGKKLFGFLGSTWSQYVVAHTAYVVKLDPRLPLAHGSFLSCGFSTGLGGSWFDANVHKGSTVAVLGLGAVGLGAVQGAKIQGASKIIGIDKNPLKREKGEMYGMTDFINPDEASGDKPISQLIMDLTGGQGVDYSFECTGAPALVTQALESTKAGRGLTVVIGAAGKPTMEMHALSLLTGRTIKGSIFGGIKIQSHFPVIVEKCINKEIDLDHLLTHEISFDEMDKALELLRQSDCVKILIKM
ncbi:zinc-binding dehydrogenase, partial [Paucibacter sp. DJ4R-1]|nr:zinc-binding dehydrogenase [Paucibacter sp. DJ4R-1]